MKAFSVRVTGRAGLIYREGDRVMRVDSEILVGPDFDYVIWLDSIDAWEPPHDGEPITAADKERIRANIAKELSTWRIDWQE